MTDEIKLNPFVNLFPDPNDSKKWIVQAPFPGKGLGRFRLDEEHFPKVFQLCSKFGEEAFTYFDFQTDLSDAEKAEFIDAGIFLSNGVEPKKPVFSCPLDTLDETTPDRLEDLIVNPTMWYEPFDLSKFRSWAAEMNLSPYLPSIWIRNSQTGLSSGYWVTQEQGAQLSQLVAGQSVNIEIEPVTLNKLFTAGIVVSKKHFDLENGQQVADIHRAHKEFSDNKYSVLRGVLPRTQIQALREFYRDFEAQGFMKLGDDFVPLRFVAPLEPLASTIHRDLTQLMNSVAGREVKPAYCYASSYLGGADLPAHTDRPQCEFSFSVQIDYRPLPDDGVSPWPLCLDVDGEEKALYLSGGDCLAYKGCELTHYRPRLTEGHRSTSLFLHYVPVEFEGSLI